MEIGDSKPERVLRKRMKPAADSITDEETPEGKAAPRGKAGKAHVTIKHRTSILNMPDNYKINLKSAPLFTLAKDDSLVGRFFLVTNSRFKELKDILVEYKDRQAYWMSADEISLHDMVYVNAMGEYFDWTLADIEHLIMAMDASDHNGAMYVYDYRTALNVLCLLTSKYPADKELKQLREDFKKLVETYKDSVKQGFNITEGSKKPSMTENMIIQKLNDNTITFDEISRNYAVERLGYNHEALIKYATQRFASLQRQTQLIQFLNIITDAPASLQMVIMRIQPFANKLQEFLNSPKVLDFDKLYGMWKLRDTGMYTYVDWRTFLNNMYKNMRHLDMLTLLALSLACPPATYASWSQPAKNILEHVNSRDNLYIKKGF